MDDAFDRALLLSSLLVSGTVYRAHSTLTSVATVSNLKKHSEDSFRPISVLLAFIVTFSSSYSLYFCYRRLVVFKLRHVKPFSNNKN